MTALGSNDGNNNKVENVSRLDAIERLIIDVPFNTIASLAYIPGGAVRMFAGTLQAGIGGLIKEEWREAGIQKIAEGAKRIVAPAVTALDGVADVASTLVAAKRTSLLKGLKPDVSKDMVSTVIAAKKEKIEERNINKSFADRMRTRGAGVGKILYGASIGIFVETAKGAAHALHGVTAVVTGAAKFAAGTITGNQQWKDNAKIKMQGGTRMIATGLAAPVAAPASLILGGAYNMVTGKESSMSYESVKKTNDLLVKAGAGKYTKILNNQDKPSPRLTRTEKILVEKMQASLQANQRAAYGTATGADRGKGGRTI